HPDHGPAAARTGAAVRDEPIFLGGTQPAQTAAALPGGDGAVTPLASPALFGAVPACRLHREEPLMPISAQRIIRPETIRNFGHFGDAIEVPPLTDVQTKSYDRFLQLDVATEKRTATGLEGVLREIFPIESYDKSLSLQYIKYELGKPRYDPDECRQLRLT